MKKLLTLLLVLSLPLTLWGCASVDAAAEDAAAPPGQEEKDALPETPAEDVPMEAPAAERAPADAYRLEKLNQACDLVLARQAVPEDLLRYLDGSLAEQVREYNSATASLKQQYFSFAQGVVDSLSPYYGDVFGGAGGYAYTEFAFRFMDRLSTLALYQNASDLIGSDPDLSGIAALERGGSYGMWAASLHEDYYVGIELFTQATIYFELVENLLTQFDEARASMN